jgi:hypothetical protein
VHLASIFAADPGPQPRRLAHLVKRELRSSSASILLDVSPKTGPEDINIAGLCVVILLLPVYVVGPEHASPQPTRTLLFRSQKLREIHDSERPSGESVPNIGLA